MLIEFLKTTPFGPKGAIREVGDGIADLLIKTNRAKRARKKGGGRASAKSKTPSAPAAVEPVATDSPAAKASE